MKFGSPSSYTLPIIFAIIVHVIGALLLFSQWPDFNKKKLPPVPKFITASVVQEQNQVVKKQQEKKRKQAVREKKRKQEAQKRKLKQEAEKKKKRLLAQKKRAQAIKKAKQLEKKRAQQKKLAKAKKQAEQKKLAEKKKRAEQQRLAEEQRKKKAWEQELLEKRALEEAEKELQREVAEAIEAERQAAITDDFSSQIKQHVTAMWNYPHSVTNPNLEVKVRVTLLPTGQVMGVVIISSSGQAVLDESVEKAIYAASPLPVPEDSAVFEKQFRRFTMKFRPEDAVL